MSPPRAIAIYDLDRTITSVPTWTFFLLFAARRLAPWRLALVPLLPLQALAKTIGLIDRDRLKELMHRTMLGPRLPAARIEATAAAFADLMIARHIRPGALAQIAADRRDGYRIVIATASHAFVAAPIAERLGIDDLIATRARYDAAGHLLHTLDGPNRYAGAKHAAVLAWLSAADRDAATVRFYSDDVSDAATLGWADEPVAVNPSPPLRRLAAAKGWPIRDWGVARSR
ncbi:HAD family hydrolase [Sphingomonas sp. Tas61C01]|uniref:HAD family hydrolase n=1 Tax=Sphingomonas sp. Tas61C01 TaxID=3458297 RepID=UPI00403E8794